MFNDGLRGYFLDQVEQAYDTFDLVISGVACVYYFILIKKVFPRAPSAVVSIGLASKGSSVPCLGLGFGVPSCATAGGALACAGPGMARLFDSN